MKRLSVMLAMIGVALAAPAVAQTKTGDYVTTTERLPDADNDNKIYLQSLAKTTTPALPSKTTVYGPCVGSNQYAWRYRVRVACDPYAPPTETPPPVVTPPVEEPPVVTPPPPVPDPVTPPAGIKATLNAAGESYLQNDSVSVGLANTASIGTITNTSPSGFRTDKAHGFNRLGFFGLTGSDVILPDAAIGGGTLYVNGTAQSGMRLRGYTQLVGRFTDPLNWQGGALGIDVKIAFALVGKELSQTVTFTNTTSKPAMVQYQWSADPDQTDASVTTQRVTAAGTVESTLANGAGVYYLTSPDAGAYITRAATFTWTKIGDTMAVGTSRKADDVVQLVMAPTLLQPGASTTFRMAQGLR